MTDVNDTIQVKQYFDLDKHLNDNREKRLMAKNKMKCDLFNTTVDYYVQKAISILSKASKNAKYNLCCVNIPYTHFDPFKQQEFYEIFPFLKMPLNSYGDIDDITCVYIYKTNQ